ncbi:GNAT family N-acetyltransferase [Microvirga flavescens]|uniref:GNAT family N-acetyltransferase n=1 Tax=Microvirga flavescens TaxID=2249811 RepID=UPI000DD86760|nr:GNAT family protein [Microvirga flavescens]
MSRVSVQPVRFEDGEELVAANLASIALHEPWVFPCRDQVGFMTYLNRCDGERHLGFIVRERASGHIAGVINLNEVVRGLFQNAFVGYYGIASMNGRGLMREGLSHVAALAFGEFDLHRLEANIQPDNLASRALAERVGFRLEGYSPRYLKIGGEWRDHERWAVLAEDWKAA